MHPVPPADLWLSTDAYESFKSDLYKCAFAEGKDSNAARFFVQKTIKALYDALPEGFYPVLEAHRLYKEAKIYTTAEHLVELLSGEKATDDKKLAGFVKDLRVLMADNIWLYTCPDLDMNVPDAVKHLAPKFEYEKLNLFEPALPF